MGKVKQAFPFVEPADHESIKAYHTGMSLRDYFAAKAMQVILADQYSDGVYVGDSDNDSEKTCARSAYIMADAMMEARK